MHGRKNGVRSCVELAMQDVFREQHAMSFGCNIENLQERHGPCCWTGQTGHVTEGGLAGLACPGVQAVFPSRQQLQNSVLVVVGSGHGWMACRPVKSLPSGRRSHILTFQDGNRAFPAQNPQAQITSYHQLNWFAIHEEA